MDRVWSEPTHLEHVVAVLVDNDEFNRIWNLVILNINTDVLESIFKLRNCAVDGVDQNDLGGTYGIHAVGSDGVSLKLVTQGPYSRNVGSRLYLLDSSGQKYKKLQLLNKEFTFTVKASDLDCGLNGALYLVEMDADGGMSYPGIFKAA